jgi:hypothetical protein
MWEAFTKLTSLKGCKKWDAGLQIAAPGQSKLVYTLGFDSRPGSLKHNLVLQDGREQLQSYSGGSIAGQC